MDSETQRSLARLIRSTRLAALATLRDGLPQVSLVAFAPAADFSAFYLHLHRLSPHSIDLQKESRLALLIAEPDDGREDLQTLLRISFRGSAEIIELGAPGYTLAKKWYLERFPGAEKAFSQPEFNLWRVSPKGASFTTASGYTFNLTVEALIDASQVPFEEGSV